MVKLSEILIALEETSVSTTAFLNKENDEILWLFEYDKENSTYLEDDEFNPNIIRIFEYYDKDDYNIMKDFIFSLEDEKLIDELLSSIRGKGAFQRFRYIIDNNNLTSKWFKYKEERYKDIVVKWCQTNNIEFEDDVISIK